MKCKQTKQASKIVGSLLNTENTEAETTQETKQGLLAGKYKTTEDLEGGTRIYKARIPRHSNN